jgi:hypothetical protein
MNYKSKKECKEFKSLFYSAFKHVNEVIDDYSFYFRLIGSAKRNLVIEKHNKGFDFDYQIIFYQSIVCLNSEELKKLKKRFRDAFDDFFACRGYKNGDDSTSAITIKKLEDNQIHHSYDVTLMSYNSNNVLCIMKYYDNHKTIMGFNEMKNSPMYNEKYKKIKGTTKWAELREKYLKKQKDHNGEKKSFSLLMEVVNEIQI